MSHDAATLPLSPQPPPKDSAPEQTGLPMPGWGKPPLRLLQALPAAAAVPKHRERDPELPAGSCPVATLWVPQHGQLYPIQGRGFSRNSQNVCTPAWPCRRQEREVFRRILRDMGRNAGWAMPGAAAERASGKGSTGAGGGQRCPGGHTVTSLRGQEAQVPLDGGTRSGALVNTASHAAATVPVAPGCRAAAGARGCGTIPAASPGGEVVLFKNKLR